jgi:glyceraldehyde-3-phosphate dehydrogenase (NAD(P))
MKPRILINGFGTIGKRAAHAISLQDDMVLAGIANRSASINVRNMLSPGGLLKGTPLYSSVNDKDKIKEMKEFNYKGTLEQALKNADVVIDSTPGGIEASYKPMYNKAGVKQIYQGGASAGIAQASFSALGNYSKCVNKKSLRVVSCNTTSLVRTLGAVDKKFGIKEAFVVLVRRAVDPDDSKKGPINAIAPVTEVPSHHGPDVKTILPINIQTMAAKVPTTLAHTHFITAKLKKKASRVQIMKLFESTPRVMIFSAKNGYTSTAEIIEYFRDLGRPGYNMYEAAVWEETVNVKGENLYWAHAVHSEGIVVPETIDAIRAITGIDKNPASSILKTNKSLGIN